MSVAGTKRCSDSVPLIHSYNCTRYSPGDASPRNCPCHSIVSRSLLTLWKYFTVKVPTASLFILFTFQLEFAMPAVDYWQRSPFFGFSFAYSLKHLWHFRAQAPRRHTRACLLQHCSPIVGVLAQNFSSKPATLLRVLESSRSLYSRVPRLPVLRADTAHSTLWNSWNPPKVPRSPRTH